LPLDVPVVVYLGVMSSYQGIDLLLDSIVRLKQSGTQTRFLIMGFPEKRYRARAESLGIADMITFTGKIDYSDAPLFLSAGDLAVSPKLSLTEANGKLFNYMACALPVVAFDTPVNREVLGDTGRYARYGDVDDLADQIAILLGDDQARRSRSEAVRRKAVQEHAWHTRAAMLVEHVYTPLLRRS
jgi:glycosyltransferase involved in cell wall biosynthesis